MAGVDIFDNFGFFPTVVALARKMGKGYDEILMMEADTVYMTLLLDLEISEYEKRLHEVKKGNDNSRGT